KMADQSLYVEFERRAWNERDLLRWEEPGDRDPPEALPQGKRYQRFGPVPLRHVIVMGRDAYEEGAKRTKNRRRNVKAYDLEDVRGIGVLEEHRRQRVGACAISYVGGDRLRQDVLERLKLGAYERGATGDQHHRERRRELIGCCCGL